MKAYDENNVFAKMLKGDIPVNKIYEDDFAIAFKDIHPKAPVHLLVIPKGAYTDFSDFSTNAPAEEIAGFSKPSALWRKNRAWLTAVTVW